VDWPARWWWSSGAEAVRSPARAASPDPAGTRPMSPDGLGRGMFTSYILGSGLEGLICGSPAVRQPRHAISSS